MAALRSVWLGAVALLTGGCGDPFVDADYRAEPQATYLTTLRIESPPERDLIAGRDRFLATIYWGRPDATIEALDTFFPTHSTAHSTQIQRPFQYHLFDRPPPEALIGGRFALGRQLLHFDQNGSGTLDGDERLAGWSEGQGIIFAASALSAEDSPTGAPLGAGYHLVQLPIPSLCGIEPERPPTCAMADLGAPCVEDNDCSGICLRSQVLFWVGGACALSANAACVPENAGYLAGSNAAGGYFIKGCSAHSDCKRNDDASYYCDTAARGCLPDQGIALAVGRTPRGALFCGGPMGDLDPKTGKRIQERRVMNRPQ